MQLFDKYFSIFSKIGRKSISTVILGFSRPPKFKKNTENIPKQKKLDKKTKTTIF